MSMPENTCVFHTYRRKLINIKKTPVVYFLCCNSPMRESVNLLTEESIQVVKAPRFAFYAVENLYIFINKCLNLPAFVTEIPQSFFNNLFFTVPLNNLLIVSFCIVR